MTHKWMLSNYCSKCTINQWSKFNSEEVPFSANKVQNSCSKPLAISIRKWFNHHLFPSKRILYTSGIFVEPDWHTCVCWNNWTFGEAIFVASNRYRTISCWSQNNEPKTRQRNCWISKIEMHMLMMQENFRKLSKGRKRKGEEEPLIFPCNIIWSEVVQWFNKYMNTSTKFIAMMGKI